MNKIKRIELTVVPRRGKPLTKTFCADEVPEAWPLFDKLGEILLAAAKRKVRRPVLDR